MRSTLRRYAFALIVSAIAVAISLQLKSFAPSQLTPWLLAAVMLSAWYGGLGPGLLAAILTTAASQFFFTPPIGQFAVATTESVVGLLIYASTAALIAVLGGSLRLARQQAERAQHDAETNADRLFESEERYRRVLNTAGEGVWMVGPQGDTDYVNRRMADMLGYNVDELRGRNFLDFVDPTTQAEAERRFAWQRQGVRGQYDLCFRRRNDSVAWAIVASSPLQDDYGNFTGVLYMVTDITERHYADEALQKSEEKFRGLFESAAESVLIADSEGRITLANARVEEVFGYSREEVIGEPIQVLLPDSTAAASDGVKWGRHKDGHEFPVEVGLSQIPSHDGPVTMALVLDITQRKAAEGALEQRVRQQEAVVDIGQRALAGGDLDELFTAASERVARTLGVELCKVLELLPDGRALLVRAGVGFRPGVVGHALVDAGTDTHAGYTLRSNAPVVVTDLPTEPRFHGMRLLHEHGVKSGMSVVIQGHGRPFGIFTAHSVHSREFTADDVRFLQAVAHVLATAIERKRAESVLTAERNWSRTTLASIGDAVITTDVQGRVTFVNHVAETLTGWAHHEAAGRPLDEVFHIVDAATRTPVDHPALSVLQEGVASPSRDQVLLVARDGHETPVEDSGAPMRASGGEISGVVLVFRDVTERKRVDRELRESREQLVAILSSIAEGITVQAPGGELIFTNDAAARLLGFASATALMESGVARIRERYDIQDESGASLPLERMPGRMALQGHRAPPIVTRLRHRETGEVRYSQVEATPVFDERGQVRFAINVFRDVTEDRREEERQRFLAEASGVLASSLDYETTMANVARLAVPAIADWCIVHILDEAGVPRPLAVAHADPAKVEWARDLQQRYPPNPASPGGVYQMLRSGESQLLPDVSDELLSSVALDAEHLRLLRAVGFRSYMGVPLVLHGSVLGAIIFVSAEGGRRFDRADLALADELAHRVVTAIENARLYREAQLARGEAEAAQRRAALLAEAGTVMAATHDYEAALARVLRLAVSRVADWGVVLLRERDQSLRLVAAAHADPARTERVRTLYRRYPLETSIAAAGVDRAMRMGAPELVREVTADDLEASAQDAEHLRLMRELGIRGYLNIPLVVRGEPIGAITLVAARPEHDFTQADLALAEDLARRIGIQIDNTWLYRRAQAARADAEAAQQRSAFLAEASSALAASLDYEATLAEVARLAVPAIADLCVVALPGANDAARLAALVDTDPERARRLRAHWDENLTDPDSLAIGLARVLRTGEAEFLPDTADLALARAGVPAPFLNNLRQEGFDGYLCVPLVARGQVLGSLALAGTPARRRFDSVDLALAEDLARRGSLAADNARLYAETQEAVRAREQFLSIASHELRTPVTVLQGYTQGLLRMVNRQVARLAAQPDSPTQPPNAVQLDRVRLTTNLRKMEDSLRRLTALIDELLDVTHFLQSGTLGISPEHMDLRALLNTVLEDARVRQGNAQHINPVRVIAHTPAQPVWGIWDRSRLEQVLVNLVDNAIKYSAHGGEVEVRLDVDPGGHTVHLSVHDQGIGVPPDQQTRLFQPFMRATNASTRNYPGLGLGLAISKQIVEHHRGRIWVESLGQNAGSTFHVVLPRVPVDHGEAVSTEP